MDVWVVKDDQVLHLDFLIMNEGARKRDGNFVPKEMLNVRNCRQSLIHMCTS